MQINFECVQKSPTGPFDWTIRLPVSTPGTDQPLANLDLYCEKRWNCYDRIIHVIDNQTTTGALSAVGNAVIQTNESITLATCDAGVEFRSYMKFSYKDANNASVDQWINEATLGQDPLLMRFECVQEAPTGPFDWLVKLPATTPATDRPLSDLSLYCEKKWNCFDRPIVMVTNQPSPGAIDGTGTVTIQMNESVTLATCGGGLEYRGFMMFNYKDGSGNVVQQVSEFMARRETDLNPGPPTKRFRIRLRGSDHGFEPDPLRQNRTGFQDPIWDLEPNLF